MGIEDRTTRPLSLAVLMSALLAILLFLQGSARSVIAPAAYFLINTSAVGIA
jgi:hypothetical protein